jgi:hypothetical protein
MVRGMAVAVMSNPPPGLRVNPLPLAIVGNPKRRRTSTPQERPMTPKEKKAFAAKMKAARAAKAKGRSPTVTKSKAAKRTARKAKRTARRAAAPRAKAIVVTANAEQLKAVKVNPGKRRRKLRRNPDMKGFLADVTGSFSELKSLGTPQGMIWAGAGAASSAVLGSMIAPQVAKLVPAMSQPLARGLNAATYAVAGLAPALLVKDSSKRRKFILGALGVAISEGLFPWLDRGCPAQGARDRRNDRHPAGDQGPGRRRHHPERPRRPGCLDQAPDRRLFRRNRETLSEDQEPEG